MALLHRSIHGSSASLWKAHLDSPVRWQSRDEQSIAMRTSHVLRCNGSELRSVGPKQFYVAVDAAGNIPANLASVY
jgi:hypothetical protein